MSADPFAEILGVSRRKEIAEVGGAHNQKGIEFQRHWAILRMLELEEAGASDFLLLFETIQDVAVLDSCTAPSAICVYQIKKRERKEWKWGDLTALHEPEAPEDVSHRPKLAPSSKSASKRTRKRKLKDLTSIQDSPLGKIYAAVVAFKGLNGTGCFVSNADFDLPLADGTNAASHLRSPLSALSDTHVELLSRGLETLHDPGESLRDLGCIHLERVPIPVDQPGTYLTGLIYEFLYRRSRSHAGQARALLDSLLAKIAPRGAKTRIHRTFDEMRRERGFSKTEFREALSILETVPDIRAYLDHWLTQLTQEGASIMEITAIRAAAAQIFSRQLLGNKTDTEQNLVQACDLWLESQPAPKNLRVFLKTACDALRPKYPLIKQPEIAVNVLIRAIKRCTDPISENL